MESHEGFQTTLHVLTRSSRGDSWVVLLKYEHFLAMQEQILKNEE
jgi:hypothetical protein